MIQKFAKDHQSMMLIKLDRIRKLKRMKTIEAIQLYINTVKNCLVKTPNDENLKGQLFAYENCLYTLKNSKPSHDFP